MAQAVNPTPPVVDKSASFKTLASARTSKALNAIKIIGNLANKANYEYTDEQVQKILDALDTACAQVDAAFKNPGVKASSGFSV